MAGSLDFDVQKLAVRYGLPARAREKLMSLSRLVSADELAPTALRQPSVVVRDHLADSLVALDLPEVRAARVIADIGAGAGFPGLPLAIALPSSSLALVEGNGRKCQFLERAVASSGTANAYVVHSRVEEWRDGLGALDLVTARALGPLAVVAEYAAPLLRIGGALVAWRGRRDSNAETQAERAADELGLEARPPTPVEPYPEALHRHLHLMVKVRPTPTGFPRRPGSAAKRPLGARASDRPRR